MWKVDISYVTRLVGNVPEESMEKRKSTFSTSCLSQW